MPIPLILGGALQGAACAAIVGGTIYGVQQFLQVYRGRRTWTRPTASAASRTALA